MMQPLAVPEILAPAGNKPAFLAALAAGADAVYCGLKKFSARMEAANFTIEELSGLTALAHEQKTRVYVAFNSLIRSDEIAQTASLVQSLVRNVGPDAMIVQDLALISLARQLGFSGEIHLSTLANAGFAAALHPIRRNLDIQRVVIPRELNIDEIKTLAGSCPPGLDLEVFVHGALCYGISGRCYWSSYLGGKSGLRGRCVQPCRRHYEQGGRIRRFFSCQDLSLDTLVKTLLPIPQIRAWKIEGRKKGPHYVYYTVKAYQMLRDHGDDSRMKKSAMDLLAQALGRPSTHYRFLPQRPWNPVDTDRQTGSGLLMGNIQGSGKSPYLIPREALLPGDVLRIGYEDEPGHAVYRVGMHVPKKGRLHLKFSAKPVPARGTPVFLVDRREPALEQLIREQDERLQVSAPVSDAPASVQLPRGFKGRIKPMDLTVCRSLEKHGSKPVCGLWLSKEALAEAGKKSVPNIWWWLSPAVWPEEEPVLQPMIRQAIGLGARRFVLNAPWQTGFFEDKKDLNLWAGPFCNIANELAIEILASLGFSGAIVSPELSAKDYLDLPEHSPLPLGIVIEGFWPLCISRVLSDRLEPLAPFSSPKGELAWASPEGGNYWIYPNWKLDVREKLPELQKAGYSMFVHLDVSAPKSVGLKKRPGIWNWEIGLL